MTITFARFSTSNFASVTALHAAGALIAAGVALTFYRGIYVPLDQDWADRMRRIEQVRALISVSEHTTGDYQELSERLKKLSAAARDVRHRMPKTISASEFVDQASRLAETLGLNIEKVQAADPQQHETYATINVSCLLRGSYASICRFLAAVDQLPQLSKVSQLDLTRATDSGDYPLEVTFQLYYQVDPLDKDQQQGTL
jgi:Tfp pilus assembly protein PilO